MKRLHRVASQLAARSGPLLRPSASLASLCIRYSSTSTSTSSNGSVIAKARDVEVPAAGVLVLNEASFHEAADRTLEAIIDALAVLESDASFDDVDISYSQGVLNINLGALGFWVINKQTPNRQLWWSSPLSGPRRYELVQQQEGGGEGRGASKPVQNKEWWKNTRDETNLLDALKSEMKQVTGLTLDL